MTEKLKIDIKADIATITFTMPKRHNALDDEVIAALSSNFDKLENRQDVRAVVIKGEGKSFCVGADINWMARAEDYSAEENIEDAAMLAKMLYKLYTLSQMTIACVQGRAMGGGLGMAAACDYVIAEESAVFAFPEVKIGMTPATIAPYVMEAIGTRAAKRYFQTAENFTAEQAHNYGLVQQLVDDQADMENVLGELLKGLQTTGPHAVTEAKKLCLDLQGQKIDVDTAKETASRLASIRSEPEAREGLKAFLEKRKPDFKAVSDD